jgi:hypothetical protein
MSKLKYVFLSLSAVEFAIGFSNARPNAFFYLGLPLGAILFILFLISQFLEKESALYDEQNRATDLVRQSSVRASRPKENVRPGFQTAHSH